MKCFGIGILAIVLGFLSADVDASQPSNYLIAQASGIGDPSSLIAEEGVGFGEFVVGNPRCTMAFIKSRLGEPAAESTDQWLNYIPQYGFHFWMPTSPRTNQGNSPGPWLPGQAEFGSHDHIFYGRCL